MATDAFFDGTPLSEEQFAFLPNDRTHLNSVIKELTRVFRLPAETRHTVRYGWDVIAILFEDNIVVRFPRNVIAWKKMQREEIVLGKVAPLLPYPVPIPQTMTKPRQLSVHRMIPGRNLTRCDFRSWSHTRQQSLAEELADLFLAFHNLPASLFEFGIQQSTTRVTLTDALDRIRKEQKYGWLQHLEKPLTKGFARWLQHDSEVFSHFDLHGSNILMDPKKMRISGIIDFLDCGVGSKFYDISKVSKIDIGLVESVWRAYSNRADRAERLIQLIALYGILEQLSDILICEISRAKATKRMKIVQGLVEILED